MRKLFSFVTLLFLSVSASAQIGVTRFLGIPVNGTKAEMIQKLKAKGFNSNPYDKEILEGEFNGKDVRIHVVTNKDKVYRIMVVDANPTNEVDIRINFNNLCCQFSNNEKYSLATDSIENFILPDNEDIDYEISVHNKRYEVAFYQKPDIVDSVAFINSTHPYLIRSLTEEEINNPTNTQRRLISSAAELARSLESLNNIVWFMITRKYGEYRIALYYDNVRNQANGEDL